MFLSVHSSLEAWSCICFVAPLSAAPLLLDCYVCPCESKKKNKQKQMHLDVCVCVRVQVLILIIDILAQGLVAISLHSLPPGETCMATCIGDLRQILEA